MLLQAKSEKKRRAEFAEGEQRAAAKRDAVMASQKGAHHSSNGGIGMRIGLCYSALSLKIEDAAKQMVHSIFK